MSGSRRATLAAAYKLAVEFGHGQEPRPFTAPIESHGLINATPMGMPGVASICHGYHAMPAAGWVFDMVTSPPRRPCSAAAKARGLGTIDGLAMLIEQAADSFRLLFGKDAPRHVRCRTHAVAPAMIKLALTGSIGMGKSTVAAMFTEAGVPVFDADAEVRRMQGPGGALVAAIEAAFRARLSTARSTATCSAATCSPTATSSPRSRRSSTRRCAEARERFLASTPRGRWWCSTFRLLFENGGEAAFDEVLVVSAPPEVQRERVLARPGMTPSEVRRRSSRCRCPTPRSARAPTT